MGLTRVACPHRTAINTREFLLYKLAREPLSNPMCSLFGLNRRLRGVVVGGGGVWLPVHVISVPATSLRAGERIGLF